MEKLHLWTVYFSPSDFPGKIVAREFCLNEPTENHFASTEYDEVITWIEERAREAQISDPIRVPRTAHDDPCIMEVWV